MSAAVTQWFKPGDTPIYVGVYEVQSHHFGEEQTWFSYWTGFHFCYRSQTPKEAFFDRGLNTVAPGAIEWRGLSDKPADDGTPA